MKNPIILLLLPMIGGAAGFCLGKKNKRVRNVVVDMVFVAQIAILCMLAGIITGENSGIMADYGMGFSFRLDAIHVFLCVQATICFGVVFQFMKESMRKEKRSNRFYLLFLCMYSMLLGAYMADNLFGFIVFTVLALLVAYPLITHWKSKVVVRDAGIYILFVFFSAVCLSLGAVVVYRWFGNISFAQLYTQMEVPEADSIPMRVGMLLFIGMAMIAGAFPAQFQVTRGQSHGLIEVSAVLANTASKLGVFGILILMVDFYSEHVGFGRILLVIGILTAVWGILISLTSTDIRRMLMGINVASNGFHLFGIAMLGLAGTCASAVRGSIYPLVISSLFLLVLYMVALELVRKAKTYQIKGLIASGKGRWLLAAACLLSCANLAGLPGTAGFLSYSMQFHTIYAVLGWKSIYIGYIVLWAFFITAVFRIFMQLFVSKKDETIHILATEEELQAGLIGEDRETDEKTDQKAYLFGEILLLAAGVFGVVTGLMPMITAEWGMNLLKGFFHLETMGTVAYYGKETVAGCLTALVLAVLFYMNLVHGILLRSIKNQKTRELQESMKNKGKI